ncbi:MAG: hypothetical protein PVG20_03475 [Thioalkalispiraceae bacterium]|jgi:hypothetical protein
MASIRRIKGSVIADYVKRTIVEHTVEQLSPVTQVVGYSKRSVRRELDRRCGRDRRQQQRSVLIDLRSPHARRKHSRRDLENDNSIKGIDTYV